MTELEKKAFEYREKLVPYAELGYPDVEIPVYSALDINRAYIAGAKENGVIWHDLKTNPNDLPVASIFNEVLNENGNKVFYDDINKTWNMFFNNYMVRANTPNFWCEIPKFKKE